MFTLNNSPVKVACVVIREYDKGNYQSVECTLINDKFETLDISLDKIQSYGDGWSRVLGKELSNYSELDIDTDSIDYVHHYFSKNNVQLIEHKCYVPRLKDL